MRRWLIEKLGGYPDAEAAYAAMDKTELTERIIEWVREQPLKDKNAWLTLAVKRLFNTVGPDDILRVHESGHTLWRGKPLNDAQVNLLKEEAISYKKGFLWEVVAAELRYQANRRMFINSEDVIDMTAGKLLVYYIDVVETRLKRLAEGK